MASPDDRVHVVIPVKSLARAKSRLQPLMPAAPRRALVLAMFLDTLAAAQSAEAVAAVTVVTNDAQVAAEAAARGAAAIGEPVCAPGIDGLNAAVAAAADPLTARGRAVLVLHADLPAVTGTAVSAAVAAGLRSAAGRAFVADRAGTGTTALLAGPGVALDPRFGPGSAAAHRDSGAAELAAADPGLRCDVDTVADLRRVLHLGAGPRTMRAAPTEAFG